MAITNNNISRSIENDSSDNLELNSIVVRRENNSSSNLVGADIKIESEGDQPVAGMYAATNVSEYNEGTALNGLLIGSLDQAKYLGNSSNVSWASVYGTYSIADVYSTSGGNLSFLIGSNIVSRARSGNTDINDVQGIHCSVDIQNANVEHAVVCVLDYDGNGTGNINGNFSYLYLTDDVPANVGGQARAIDSRSTLKSQLAGALQIGETPNMSEEEVNAGSLRYIETANRSAVEMLMKTGASAYSWVVIQENTF